MVAASECGRSKNQEVVISLDLDCYMTGGVRSLREACLHWERCARRRRLTHSLPLVSASRLPHLCRSRPRGSIRKQGGVAGSKPSRNSFRFCRAKLVIDLSTRLHRDKIVGDNHCLPGAKDDWLAPASPSSPHNKKLRSSVFPS
jgi:hypothetical protein